MKLKNQVVSLELAKKLKELGVKQESCFFHIPVGNGKYDIVSMGWRDTVRYKSGDGYSAFTVAELGEMLVTGDMYSCKFKVYRDVAKLWWLELGYTENRRIDETQMFIAETEVDARAKMLIYLIENKLI